MGRETVVYLIRHGEDQAAASGRFGDEGLSPAGVEQARTLAKRLASIRFARCLVSPLARARETAEHALSQCGDVPVEITPTLAEGVIGALAGLSYEEGERRHPLDFQQGRTLVARIAASGRTAPEGETRDAFLARARGAADRLRAELETGDDVVVFSHGGLLNYALQILLEMPVVDRVSFGFDHCAVARLVRHVEPPDFGPFPSVRFSADGSG